MTIAIADTETTGFFKDGALVQSGQARILQLAVLLCDDDGKHRTEFNTLIRLNDDIKVSKGAQDIHGISWDDCNKYGIRIESALAIFQKIVANAKVLVFHNKGFDLKMLDIEEAYAGRKLSLPNSFCTMLATMDICKLPGKYGKNKWPKLNEALPILCNKEIGENAHDAMVDTRAAKDVYFELVKRKLV